MTGPLQLIDRWRFGLLLALLLGLFLTQPFLDRSEFGQTFAVISAGAILIGAFRVSVPDDRIGAIGMGLTATWLVIYFVQGVFSDGDNHTAMLGVMATILLTGLNGWCTLKALFSKRFTGIDTLYGAIFGYFLIALMWAQLYVAIELWAPGSFSFPEGGTKRSDLLYFSLVTMTTLGYGDILPVGSFPRLIAGIQAAFGTLYIAILIGRIVNAIKD
ncbi:MAG: potassium channel family protein [Pseudomonadota bacterium]